MGRRPTAETRVKLKIAAQRRAEDPEWSHKISLGKTGKPCSAEHKAALSRAKKGVPANLTEEARLLKNKKIGEANRIRPISDAMCRKISEGNKNSARVERFLFRGAQRTVLSLAEEFGLCRHVLRKRLNAGWDIEVAVVKPVRGSK